MRPASPAPLATVFKAGHARSSNRSAWFPGEKGTPRRASLPMLLHFFYCRFTRLLHFYVTFFYAASLGFCDSIRPPSGTVSPLHADPTAICLAGWHSPSSFTPYAHPTSTKRHAPHASLAGPLKDTVVFRTRQKKNHKTLPKQELQFIPISHIPPRPFSPASTTPPTDSSYR